MPFAFAQPQMRMSGIEVLWQGARPLYKGVAAIRPKDGWFDHFPRPTLHLHIFFFGFG